MQNTLSKEDWVAMFREIGLEDAAMGKWHQLFETRHPDEHEEFLNWLGISAAEIRQIRTGSKVGI